MKPLTIKQADPLAQQIANQAAAITRFSIMLTAGEIVDPRDEQAIRTAIDGLGVLIAIQADRINGFDIRGLDGWLEIREEGGQS